MLVRRAPEPPDKVLYPSVEEIIKSASDSAPFLGYGPGNKYVAVKLDSESPHILISASPGAGKSVLLRLLAAQGLAKEGEVVICDIKRVSHSWAKGLPRVTYARSIDEIHDVLVALDAESERRYLIIDRDGEDADVGPRLFILLEEMNATIRRLERYWQKIKGPNDPKLSPAVEAIGNLLFMGRAAKEHVIAVAQMATARALGGPEARENFATRILARYSLNAWRMLVPEIWPAPKASRHSGRVQVAIAGEATETQIVFLTEQEARELALTGGTESEVAPRQTKPVSEETATPIVDLKTLGEAVKAGWLPMKYEALKRARSRDIEFPKGVTGIDKVNRYSQDELVRWFDNRERGQRGDVG